MKLKKDEAGLVITKDWVAKYYLPQINPLHDHVQYLAAIAILTMRDKKFINYVFKRWDKIINETQKTNR
jgi:hypothetical protein